MKTLILAAVSFVFLSPDQGFARNFTTQETQILRSILNSIKPIEVADSIFCSMSKSEHPGADTIIFCGVNYTDPNRWLAKFRTKWISNRVLNLLLRHGDCKYGDTWRKPTHNKPYSCELTMVRCDSTGCSAQ